MSGLRPVRKLGRSRGTRPFRRGNPVHRLKSPQFSTTFRSAGTFREKSPQLHPLQVRKMYLNLTSPIKRPIAPARSKILRPGPAMVVGAISEFTGFPVRNRLSPQGECKVGFLRLARKNAEGPVLSLSRSEAEEKRGSRQTGQQVMLRSPRLAPAVRGRGGRNPKR